MKKIITIFGLIAFFCFAGNLFFEDAQASTCDADTMKELQERKDDLRGQRDAIEQKILEVKAKLRKCNRQKRAEMRLDEAKNSKKPL